MHVELRGDDDIDAKRSRSSVGKTREVPREQRARAFGWDPISGSHQGQQPNRLHPKAEYMAAPERFAEMSDSPCTAGAVHTWHSPTSAAVLVMAAAGGLSAEGPGFIFLCVRDLGRGDICRSRSRPCVPVLGVFADELVAIGRAFDVEPFRIDAEHRQQRIGDLVAFDDVACAARSTDILAGEFGRHALVDRKGISAVTAVAMSFADDFGLPAIAPADAGRRSTCPLTSELSLQHTALFRSSGLPAPLRS